MKTSRIVTLAFKGLARNKLRSFLMMIGVVIGIAALTMIVSVGLGAQTRVLERVKKFGLESLMLRAGGGREIARPTGGQPVTTLTLEDVTALKQEIRTIADVAPSSVKSQAEVIYQDKSTTTGVFGVTPSWVSVWDWDAKEGEFITDDDIAGLVEPGQVAGVKPSLAPSIGAVIADIAVCATGTATGQLARGFPRHIAAVRTDDAKFGSASRSSHGMAPDRRRVVRAGCGPAAEVGASVSREHDAAGTRFELFGQRRGHDRSRRVPEAHAGNIDAIQLGRQHGELRGGAADYGRALARHQLERGVGPEDRHADHARAGNRRGEPGRPRRSDARG